MKFKPKARVSNLVIQNSGNNLLIFDLKTSTALSLNETSARIWQSCNGKREAADICSYLEESDGVYVDQDLVLLAIRQLSNSNLLAAKTPDSGNSERVSRRKLLRQIGAGSAVALPIIHSIVAPQASAAGSTCNTTGRPPFSQGTCPLPTQRCLNGMCQPCVASNEAINIGEGTCPRYTCQPRDPRSNVCCNSSVHCLGATSQPVGACLTRVFPPVPPGMPAMPCPPV